MGGLLATASSDMTARVSELPGAGREVVQVRHEHSVRGVAFSPDGRFLATASGDKTARVWETRS